jgi:hypothetical protein
MLVGKVQSAEWAIGWVHDRKRSFTFTRNSSSSFFVSFEPKTRKKPPKREKKSSWDTSINLTLYQSLASVAVEDLDCW